MEDKDLGTMLNKGLNKQPGFTITPKKIEYIIDFGAVEVAVTFSCT